MRKEDLINMTKRFSRKGHDSPKQVIDKPYFEYSQELARLLESWNQEDRVIAAGYLHDIVEDSNISLSQIEKEFGKRVACLVGRMSWIRTSEGLKDFGATYKKFANQAMHEPSLVLIKIIDSVANLPNLAEPSHRDWVTNKSYPRNMIFYILFIKALGLIKGTNKIVQEFHKYTKEPVQSVLFGYLDETLLKIKSNKGSEFKINLLKEYEKEKREVEDAIFLISNPKEYKKKSEAEFTAIKPIFEHVFSKK